eukprot:m.128080 g.128080  ORF g.128080 m.128080 type:complete len:60 (-) comp13018_c1_seq2:53-232(-)
MDKKKYGTLKYGTHKIVFTVTYPLPSLKDVFVQPPVLKTNRRESCNSKLSVVFSDERKK